MIRSTCAPGVQDGSVSPSGSTRVSATTSSATTSTALTTRSPSCSRTVVRVSVTGTVSGLGGDTNGEPLDAVHEVAAHPDDVPGLLDGCQPRQQRLEHDPHLESGEVGAHAGVRPLAERHVVVREAAEVKG